MKTRIYLAGPDVFYPNAKERGENLKSLCHDFGFEGVYPFDVEAEVVLGDPSCGEVIYLNNIKLIESCDIVLANMTPFRGPSMDTGTAFEMGYGAALKKRIVGYTESLTAYKDRVTPDGLLIEDFGMVDNLMMASAAERVFPTVTQALAYLLVGALVENGER